MMWEVIYISDDRLSTFLPERRSLLSRYRRINAGDLM
jgi:hypothetical protein